MQTGGNQLDRAGTETALNETTSLRRTNGSVLGPLTTLFVNTPLSLRVLW
jgi:hypothetical protein